MRALGLWQPRAELVAAGIQQAYNACGIEACGSLVAICACGDNPTWRDPELAAHYGLSAESLLFHHVLAIGYLNSFAAYEAEWPETGWDGQLEHLPVEQRLHQGPLCLPLSHVRRIHPFPYPAQPGLFHVHDYLIAKALAEAPAPHTQQENGP